MRGLAETLILQRHTHAVQLYDRQARRFELSLDEPPDGATAGAAAGRFYWRPYVASLAVASEARRRGVGRVLMGAAEEQVRQWGYRESALEVAVSNTDATSFYRRLGYRVTVPRSGTTSVCVRGRYWWSKRTVEKLVMRRALS